jgi:hypothetical protein
MRDGDEMKRERCEIGGRYTVRVPGRYGTVRCFVYDNKKYRSNSDIRRRRYIRKRKMHD